MGVFLNSNVSEGTVVLANLGSNSFSLDSEETGEERSKTGAQASRSVSYDRSKMEEVDNIIIHTFRQIGW